MTTSDGKRSINKHCHQIWTKLQKILQKSNKSPFEWVHPCGFGCDKKLNEEDLFVFMDMYVTSPPTWYLVVCANNINIFKI
jgi:hypothetical protein